MLSTIIANIFGGISVGLWKDEHQTHHLMTNHVEHDPDIQLVPFVAISTKFFNGVYSSFHETTFSFGSLARFMVRIQHLVGIFYIPVFKLLLYFAAPMFAIFSPRSKDMVKEMILIGFYYVWFFLYISYLPTFRLRLIYFLFNNGLTSIVFVQIVLAHLAMPTDEGKIVEEEFFKHQIRTTLDVSCSPWLDWFHGGLNF